MKKELPYDPAIPLLGIYPEKTIIQKEAGKCALQQYLNSQDMEAKKGQIGRASCRERV